jgi:hypothetical protein
VDENLARLGVQVDDESAWRERGGEPGPRAPAVIHRALTPCREVEYAKDASLRAEDHAEDAEELRHDVQ